MVSPKKMSSKNHKLPVQLKKFFFPGGENSFYETAWQPAWSHEKSTTEQSSQTYRTEEQFD